MIRKNKFHPHEELLRKINREPVRSGFLKIHSFEIERGNPISIIRERRIPRSPFLTDIEHQQTSFLCIYNKE